MNGQGARAAYASLSGARQFHGFRRYSLHLPKHPDEHGSGRPVLLAVDQELGEGATLRVAPELTDAVEYGNKSSQGTLGDQGHRADPQGLGSKGRGRFLRGSRTETRCPDRGSNRRNGMSRAHRAIDVPGMREDAALNVVPGSARSRGASGRGAARRGEPARGRRGARGRRAASG